MRRTAIIGTALAIIATLPMLVAIVLLALLGWLGIDPMKAVLWTLAAMGVLAVVNIAFLIKTRNE